jgi:hypothetical protein
MFYFISNCVCFRQVMEINYNCMYNMKILHYSIIQRTDHPYPSQFTNIQRSLYFSKLYCLKCRQRQKANERRKIELHVVKFLNGAVKRCLWRGLGESKGIKRTETSFEPRPSIRIRGDEWKTSVLWVRLVGILHGKTTAQHEKLQEN